MTRNELVEANYGLIYRVARSLRINSRAWDDCVQDGAIALVQAAERFDPSLGRFSTFACRYIRPAMLATLCRQQVVSEPVKKVTARAARAARGSGEAAHRPTVDYDALPQPLRAAALLQSAPEQPEETAAATERDRRVRALPPHQRAVVLAVLSGERLRDYSRRIGVPRRTVLGYWDAAIAALEATE